jgi:signal transduction histidine kinase/ActR/RegA family two-component response regulator
MRTYGSGPEIDRISGRSPSANSAFTITIAYICTYTIFALAVIPFAGSPGPEIPGIIAVFATTIFVTEVSTSFLLFVYFRANPRWSLLILGSAFLYSAFMVVPYLLTFPGAVLTSGALVGGSRHATGYIFVSWVTGFALLTFVSVLFEARTSRYQSALVRVDRAVCAAVGAVSIVVLSVSLIAILLGDYLPPQTTESLSWTGLNRVLMLIAIALLVSSVAIVLLSIRNELFLWQAMMLTTVVIAHMVSQFSGARYTVGWQTARLMWIISGCVLFLYFLRQFSRQLDQLVAAHNALDQVRQTKDHVLAIASHDLRQPLQTLFLLNGVVRRLVTDPRVAPAIAGQESAIRAMSELLDSLLDISKLEAGATKPQITDVDLDELFEGLRIEFAGIAVAKGLHLEILGRREIARTDPKLLGQVLRNLLSNALKFTNEGSVRLQCVREAGQLRIDVTDTGQGIASEHMPRIFEEFYQAGRMPNTAREGHGLGLSIVHRLIQLLGHQIKVDSIVGKGSRFSIVLPVGSAQSRVAPPARDSYQGIPINQARVMVVEDDAFVLSGICSLLETVGYRVTGVTSVGEALEQLHKQKDISLLITDFHLGNGELGTEVIRSIRSVLGREVQAFLLTGDTSTRVQIVARENDAFLMSKPINADEFLGLLAAARESGPSFDRVSAGSTP